MSVVFRRGKLIRLKTKVKIGDAGYKRWEKGIVKKKMNIKDEAFPGGGHIVLLGAGASIASSILDREKNGKKLPSMNDLPMVIPMDDLLSLVPKNLYSDNFEVLYSNLYKEDPNNPILQEMNDRVYDYFASLSLPDKPTIYDYMVMALRFKDTIVTFNWDPFLYQAWCRNKGHGSKPMIRFLHGNVAIGYDEEDLKSGPAGSFRKDNMHYLKPTPLLYPTGEKNYEEDPFIKREWKRLREALHDETTWRLTIFGYSAPRSDAAAIKLMNDAWGTPDKRNIEQIEMIDIRPEEEVKRSWDNFIHSHHYDYCTNYFQSSLARCPRRTNESYFLRCFPCTPEEAFHEECPIPEGGFATFEEMWEWHQDLIDIENNTNANPF